MQLNGMVPLFQKGCVYGDLVFGQDSLASRSISVGWETDVTEYGAEYLLSEEEGDSFIEGTHTSQNCCNRGDISVGGTLTAGLPNVLSVDDGLCTKFSSPLSEFNCPDSALINMNLRGLENQPCSENFKFQRTFFGYSAESFPPIEPSRSAGLSSQAFFCQVFGCNKDLSSSKDYHKRHRVCDRHTKTAKVIVDGIEKRFCQQCSRFHLLSEFDEGKRSCRRRLVGHNERRRKPKAGNHCGKNRRFRSYKVGMFDSKASSISNKIFHADPLQSGKVGDNSWNQQIKAEYEDYFSVFFSSPQENCCNLNPTGMISFGKHYPLGHGDASNKVHEVPEAELQCSYSSYTFSTSGKQDSNVFCTESNLNGVLTIVTLPIAVRFMSLIFFQKHPGMSDFHLMPTHLQRMERQKQSTYLMPLPDIFTTSSSELQHVTTIFSGNSNYSVWAHSLRSRRRNTPHSAQDSNVLVALPWLSSRSLFF